MRKELKLAKAQKFAEELKEKKIAVTLEVWRGRGGSLVAVGPVINCTFLDFDPNVKGDIPLFDVTMVLNQDHIVTYKLNRNEVNKAIKYYNASFAHRAQ